MNLIKHTYLIVLFFSILVLNGVKALKTVCSSENKNWPKEREEKTDSKIFSVFLIGDLKYTRKNDNLIDFAFSYMF